MEEMKRLGEEAVKKLDRYFGKEAEIVLKDDYAEPGSGALPGETIPSVVISIGHKKLSPNRLDSLFRKSDPPVIGRINNDSFLLDLRCIDRADDLVPK